MTATRMLLIALLFYMIVVAALFGPGVWEKLI